MAAKRARRVPSYRHHKPSNQAFVELDGKRIYLGRHGTPKSEQEYHRVVAEWIANGYQLPVESTETTVVELIVRFRSHAELHYRHADGSPTSEQDNYRQVLRPLKDLYGDTKAAQFGPRALKTVRQYVIDLGWSRTNINRQINRIKHVFKWGLKTSWCHHRCTKVFRRWLALGAAELQHLKPTRYSRCPMQSLMAPCRT